MLRRGFNEAKKAHEARQKADKPNRFWIPAGQQQIIGLVDDEMVVEDEHQPQINGSFRGNQITCMKGYYDEVVCCLRLGPDSKRPNSFLTGVQLTPWYDQKGQEHNFEIILMPMPFAVAEKVERRKHKNNGLAGWELQCTRSTQDKSCSVGDDFEVGNQIVWDRLLPKINFKGRRLLEMYAEADQKPEAMEKLKLLFPLEFDDKKRIIRKVYPFRYEEVLKAPTPEEAKDLLMTYAPRGGGGHRPEPRQQYTEPRDEGPSFNSGNRNAPSYGNNNGGGRYNDNRQSHQGGYRDDRYPQDRYPQQGGQPQRPSAPPPRNGGPREPQYESQGNRNSNYRSAPPPPPPPSVEYEDEPENGPASDI